MSTEFFVDAAGVAHPPAADRPRIVSLVPSLTELLFDLDLADYLVGRTHFCVHPKDRIEAIPSVGGTKKIKRDRLRALAPTHVLVNVDETPRELAASIAAEGIRVIVTHPNRPEDNPPLFRLIGGIFRRSEAAELLCDRFAAAMADLCDRPWPSRSVLYLIWRDPWMTVSRDTYIANLLALIGWHTVAHDPMVRYPEIDMTATLATGIDLVLFSSEPYRFTDADIVRFREDYPADRAELRLIDGEMTSWYGSRAILGLDYLRRLAVATLPSAGAQADPPSPGDANQRM